MEEKKKQIKIIDEYKISLESYLGEGAFGKTYEAFDDKGNIYACKVIKIESLKSEGEKKNLIRELKNGFKLKNKHIMRFYDVKRSQTNIYLFLEFCQGIPLSNFIEYYQKKFKKNLPLKLIQIITIQLINALSYLSINNVLHRDIKTDNIMLSCNKKVIKEKKEKEEKIKNIFKNVQQINNLYKITLKNSDFSNMNLNYEEEEEEFLTYNECETEEELINTIEKNYVVKLIDLGLSKEINNSSLIETVLGTPAYISPEIWKKYLNKKMGSNNPKKIDIYSTGIVLFNLIYGNNKIPFDEKFANINQLINAVIKGKYCVKKQENLCLELVDLMNGMLKVNENVRYGIEKLINHPFVVKKYEDLTNYNEEDKIYNGNDEKNLIEFEIKKNIKDYVNEVDKEKEDNSEIDKYIDNLFLHDGIIIDYITKENDVGNDWTLVELNNELI
jgi:serine/threonine protein kinase